MERLLAHHWTGDRLLALGEHAVKWFAPYAGDREVRDLWADSDSRFERSLPVRILGRRMEILPVPHPSPLSPFKATFAEILERRLRG